MLTPRSQAYTPGTRSGLAKGSRLHTLHYKENRPLSSPECSKVGFPQDALNWQNGKPRTNEPNLAGHSSALESVIHSVCSRSDKAVCAAAAPLRREGPYRLRRSGSTHRNG